MNTEELLRTVDAATGPTPEQRMRADALVARMTAEPARAPRRRVGLTWTAVGLAATITAVTVVGHLSLNAQSAYAVDVLRTAASQTIDYVNLLPGSGEYLRATTHSRYPLCVQAESGSDGMQCDTFNEETMTVYMPADADAEWVLHRDWGDLPRGAGPSIETLSATQGSFYGGPWLSVDYADIPTDGQLAYEWSDAQYIGGSSSRDEDNFARITGILRTGLVPGPQRAALLDALSRVPGVSATGEATNLDGEIGVAISRTEPLRLGQRDEIIIDPETGLVIGERTVSGAAFFGLGANEVITSSAISTSIVADAPDAR